LTTIAVFDAQELEGTRRRGRPRKGWREEVEKDLQVLGARRWRELVIDRENGDVLFDRPKPTAERQGKKKKKKKKKKLCLMRLCLHFESVVLKI
jgi:hypothetical protein